jgi:hypothetical protein
MKTILNSLFMFKKCQGILHYVQVFDIY